MAATLRQILLAPESRQQVVADCLTLIEQELADQSGISAAAVKLAYKTVNTLFPGHVRTMVERLLPEMVDQLEPYWAGCNAAGSSKFGDYLAERGREVSDALLSVTDRHAAGSEKPLLVKAYNGVRSSAFKHIEAALPRVGDLVLKYAQ
jgi:hypothetical protein